MSGKRYATKRDSTESAILRALGAVGAKFILLDAFDVLVLFRGHLTMLDCKSPKGRPTRNQEVMVQEGWPLVYVKTPDEALRAIGAIQ